MGIRRDTSFLTTLFIPHTQMTAPTFKKKNFFSHAISTTYANIIEHTEREGKKLPPPQQYGGRRFQTKTRVLATRIQRARMVGYHNETELSILIRRNPLQLTPPNARENRVLSTDVNNASYGGYTTAPFQAKKPYWHPRRIQTASAITLLPIEIKTVLKLLNNHRQKGKFIKTK